MNQQTAYNDNVTDGKAIENVQIELTSFGVPLALYQSEIPNFITHNPNGKAIIDELFDYEVAELLGLI